ncbi:MAG TPA: hypothetical protein VJA18_03520 [Candidatus Nanoarchaeia archaeon]|nr:hypothetical protein [Candidatus Nanoarchaeia archaeon]
MVDTLEAELEVMLAEEALLTQRDLVYLQRFRTILDGLNLSDEEDIALNYLFQRQGIDYLGGQTDTSSPDPVGDLIERLFARIRNDPIEGFRRRYAKAKNSPMEETYQAELKLVEDEAFQQRMFEMYRTQIWPAMKRTMN